MRPHRLQQSKGTRGAGEGPDDAAGLARRGLYGWAGLDDDSAVGEAPRSQVGARVAGIVEAVGEALVQLGGLGSTLEIGAAVAGDDGGGEGQAQRQCGGDFAIGGGRDEDRPASGGLGGRELDQAFVERQGLDVDIGLARQLLLQRGAAAQQPWDDLVSAQRVLLDEGEGAFDEQVAADQRAVEIEDERLELGLGFGRCGRHQCRGHGHVPAAGVVRW